MPEFTRQNRRLEEATGWSGCTIADSIGNFCDRPVPLGAPISVCGSHLMVAYRYCEDAINLANAGLQAEARSDWVDHNYLRRQSLLRRVSGSVVYYAAIDAFVKIGVTAHLHRRMRTLQVDQLLAVEPGYRDLERIRHRQFAHLAVVVPRQTEVFAPGDDLLGHIETLRATSDQPAAA